MTNIFFQKITLVCKYNGGRAEIALNILGFLKGLYHTTIIKTRSSPASEFRNSETCDPPATARHERAGGGGRAPGVLHHVMGRGIERKRLFIDKKDRQDLISVYLLWDLKSYARSARASPTTLHHSQ